MITAAVMLLLISLLGAFDTFYFHRHVAGLARRKESRLEVEIHVARGFIYTLQLAVVSSVRLEGAWYAALVLLYLVDVAIAWADVWIESGSRRSQGGLPRGEYFTHIVLSVLVGIYLHAIATSTLGWAGRPTALVWEANVPALLQLPLLAMAIGCLLNTLYELAELIASARPKPLHIRRTIEVDLERLWRLTQDHRIHPEWDHRFSRIEMLADEIQTGTEMLYEKRILGVTIRGFGRYKLHRPMKQSTFEFWSDDPLSLIERGRGLWLYRNAGAAIEFSTSYTYRVRWGLIGKVIDRLFFRPLMKWATERSFDRLCRMLAPCAQATS